MTLTAEQKAINLANRLAHAADPADGLTVRILTPFASHGTTPGEVVVLSRGTALQAIKDGRAESAEPEITPRHTVTIAELLAVSKNVGMMAVVRAAENPNPRSTLNRYRKLTTQAPPITVDRHNVILDGLHRTIIAVECGQDTIEIIEQ